MCSADVIGRADVIGDVADISDDVTDISDDVTDRVDVTSLQK